MSLLQGVSVKLRQLLTQFTDAVVRRLVNDALRAPCLRCILKSDEDVDIMVYSR